MGKSVGVLQHVNSIPDLTACCSDTLLRLMMSEGAWLSSVLGSLVPL